jgi:hypothetical protein
MEQVQRTADALRAASFTDIRCIECLLRFYDVRMEQYSTPAILEDSTQAAQDLESAEVTKKSTAKAHCDEELVAVGALVKHEAAEATGATEAAEAEEDATKAGGDRAETAGTAVANRNENNGAGEGRGVKRKHNEFPARSRSNYVPWVGCDSSDKLQKLVTIPKLQTKGHTGYLLFGRKPVRADEQRISRELAE